MSTNYPVGAADAGALDSEIVVHDRALQAIYGIALSLEHSTHLVDASPAEAKAGINNAITSLHAVIADLRSRIYERGRLNSAGN